MLFYFTGTGNSLYLAKRLCEKLGEEPVSMAEAARQRPAASYELQPGEKVGFVFPVYFYGLPAVVKEFVKRVSFDCVEGNLFYLVLDCGGSTGTAGEVFNLLCSARGWDLRYQNCVLMPDNYIPMFDAPSADEVKERLEEADRQISAIADDLLSGVEGDWNRHKGPVPGIASAALYPFYAGARKTKHFRVEADRCLQCGRCAADCPEGAISLKDGIPVWEKERCSLCLRCLNACPGTAIQYGKGTEKRGRYLNPGV